MKLNKRNYKNKFKDHLVNNKHFNHKRLQRQVLLRNKHQFKNKKVLV